MFNYLQITVAGWVVQDECEVVLSVFEPVELVPELFHLHLVGVGRRVAGGQSTEERVVGHLLVNVGQETLQGGEPAAKGIPSHLKLELGYSNRTRLSLL